jgi:hypothetical protein
MAGHPVQLRSTERCAAIRAASGKMTLRQPVKSA